MLGRSSSIAMSVLWGCMERDFSGRNFGLKARKMSKALEFAAREAVSAKAISHCTAANAKSTYAEFEGFLKSHKVFDLRNVERKHVVAFADRLGERATEGEISWRTATEYISRINMAMKLASGVGDVRVTAQEAGFPKRDGIARVSRAEELGAKTEGLSPQIQALLVLQREFGLRSKESVMLNAKANGGLRVGDFLRVDRGTKGGRPRDVPIRTQNQLEALQGAAAVQQGRETQIPKEMTYKEFRNFLYQDVAGVVRQHGLRHSYAQGRYAELSGVACPVSSGVEHKEHRAFIAKQLGVSLLQAAEIDRTARQEIANELGHGRIDVMNGYLG